VREFIDKHQPRWFFCGHIHEAAGRVIDMGITRAVNVGRRGYLLELPEPGT
jgi:Icc-related predicted phosphoesterase